MYKSVRCSVKVEEKIFNQGTNWERKKVEQVFETDVTNHNAKISIDLYGKDLMLIKREI